MKRKINAVDYFEVSALRGQVNVKPVFDKAVTVVLNARKPRDEPDSKGSKMQ